MKGAQPSLKVPPSSSHEKLKRRRLTNKASYHDALAKVWRDPHAEPQKLFKNAGLDKRCISFRPESSTQPDLNADAQHEKG